MLFQSDTTDIQDVIAVSTENSSFIVQCVFVSGSTARGCMVVLVGQSDNTTVNLTREGLCATGVTSTITNISFLIIIGYDIESDGTLGTLAIEGEFSNESLSCTENLKGGEHTLYFYYVTIMFKFVSYSVKEKNDIVVVVAVTVPGATVVIVISSTAIAIIIHLYRKHKK